MYSQVKKYINERIQIPDDDVLTVCFHSAARLVLASLTLTKQVREKPLESRTP